MPSVKGPSLRLFTQLLLLGLVLPYLRFSFCFPGCHLSFLFKSKRRCVSVSLRASKHLYLVQNCRSQQFSLTHREAHAPPACGADGANLRVGASPWFTRALPSVVVKCQGAVEPRCSPLAPPFERLRLRSALRSSALLLL